MLVFTCDECPNRKGDKACILILHEAPGSCMNPRRCHIGRMRDVVEWRRQNTKGSAQHIPQHGQQSICKCVNKHCSYWRANRLNCCNKLPYKISVKTCECYSDDYGYAESRPPGEPAWPNSRREADIKPVGCALTDNQNKPR